MKKLFRVLALIPVLMLVALHTLGAQTPTFPDVTTLSVEQVLPALIDPMLSLVILLSGYVSAYIPGIQKIKPFYRVLAFAFAAGIGFHLFGLSFWKVASTYFLSSGLYVVFLKNIFPSPKALIVS